MENEKKEAPLKNEDSNDYENCHRGNSKEAYDDGNIPKTDLPQQDESESDDYR